MPTHFQERIARIYLKREADGDDEMRRLKNAVGIAFRNFLHRSDLHGGVDDDHNGYGGMTPPKKKKNSKDKSAAPKRMWQETNGGVNNNNNTLPWPPCNGEDRNGGGGVAESADARLAKRERPSHGSAVWQAFFLTVF